MNNLTIQIEVNLGERTLNLLQSLLQTKPAGTPERRKPAKPIETKEADPAPAALAATPEDTGDLPGPISDEELRAAVKAAKDATSAADVRSVFAEFGINSSSECADEKRYSLLTRLIQLSKAA